MKPHRLYHLTIGFPVADTLVGLATASISYELYKALMGERIAVPLCALTGTAVFFLWLSLKPLLPRNFIPDVLDWLLQPVTYQVTRDTETPPLILQLEDSLHKEDKHDRLPN
jgi:hypothetical protein